MFVAPLYSYIVHHILGTPGDVVAHLRVEDCYLLQDL